MADVAKAALANAQEEAKKRGGDPLRAEMQAQELARQAEAAKKAAEAVPVTAQITGNYTARATGLKTVWSAEITDLSAAFKHYNKKGNPAKTLLEAAITECILQVATREARQVKNAEAAPPGIAFKSERR